MGIAIAALWWGMERMFKKEKAKSRSPFGEKMLRPAGESLRLKIEEIRDQFMETGMVLAISLVAPSLVMILLHDPTVLSNLIIWFLAAAVGYGLAVVQWRKIRNLREQLRNYNLGFDGERYVAAELNTLIGQGYRVFHDFVVDWKPGGEATNFNIDHIVVGPAGVFAIETKTRRKPLTGKHEKIGAKAGYSVTFDGKALHFPGDMGRTDAIDQAKGNAKTLSQWLTGTAKSPVEVRPLVVIPGWYIGAENWRTSGVQTTRKLAERLPGLGRGGSLTEDKIRVIADRIEAHCRDVEGA